ncbi:MAG TPA: hydrogenase accessory protein HypB [Actinobacteria bacterium]|nr:hydrogenase accessory protein HypB [Actinomycetota bacterium]
MEIKILRDVLATNEAVAKENERLFGEKKVFVLNLMASPGAGKTSFILRTIEGLKDDFKMAVVEGDIASKVDAERVREQGVPAVQINTGGACHLDANMIKNSLALLDLDEIDFLIIENVGNLVCPAEFNLGETLRAMILSIPEGDDKPLKYPLMFTESHVLIVNKMDLLDWTDFDLERFKGVVGRLNSKMKVFELSCKSGEGVEDWIDWLKTRLISFRT